MAIKREVLKFLIPVSIFGIQSETLSGRQVIPLYISPTTFNIEENKIIIETLTKGGYLVEYWGEKLPVISASGTTGSGGIEAIEILRSVYRNEQIQMYNLLQQRGTELSEFAPAALRNTNAASTQAGLVSFFDSLTRNGISEIINGTQSVIDEIVDIFEEPIEENPEPVTLIPNLGTFAVAVDLYLQGFKYRGYFKSFRISETGESPGIFNYDFTFSVLRRSGERKNFMPWHRNPYNPDGTPKPASIPLEGPRIDELSYPNNLETFNTVTNTNFRAQLLNTETAQAEINSVSINRLKSTTG